MKRIITSMLAVLLASCLLPVLFYHGTAVLLQKDLHTAAHGFGQELPSPQPSSQAAPPLLQGRTEPTPSPASTLVPIWDAGTKQVIQVPLREYVIGAVASEMPQSWPDAALQAQAVAAHTYLLYRRDHSDPVALGGAWLSADPGQRQGFMTDSVLRSYWGTRYDANYARLSALVDPVLNTILTYEGAPAAASYFAISNGKTEASQNVWSEALPYLQGVDSSWDKNAEGYATTVSFSSSQMHNALLTGLNLKPDGFRPEEYFSDFAYTDAGYVASLNVCGQHVLGTVLRSALHLRSSCFTIVWDGTAFQITTYGYGHGVGLSQTGAMAMAQQGSTWQQILEHYFPGTRLTQIE